VLTGQRLFCPRGLAAPASLVEPASSGDGLTARLGALADVFDLFMRTADTIAGGRQARSDPGIAGRRLAPPGFPVTRRAGYPVPSATRWLLSRTTDLVWAGW
jgi:hypothetical protein